MATLADPETAADPIDAFRGEARAWLAENFPPSLKGKDNAMSALEGPSNPSADEEAWRTAIGEKGWGVPTWPRALWRRRAEPGRGARAGRGDGAGRRLEPDRRDGRDDVRPHPVGVWQRGAEARRISPAIATGEVRWCQGYSEPNARARDLANAPDLSAVSDGDDYHRERPEDLDQSGGQWADKCFALVRTDKSEEA